MNILNAKILDKYIELCEMASFEPTFSNLKQFEKEYKNGGWRD